MEFSPCEISSNVTSGLLCILLVQYIYISVICFSRV